MSSLPKMPAMYDSLIHLLIRYINAGFRKVFFSFFIISIIIAGGASAQIATYTGAGGGGTTVVGVANETVTILQTVGFGANTPCSSGGISGLTNNGVFTYAPTNAHLFFQIRPNVGYQLNVTGFSANLRRSNSGITKVRFAYSLDNGVTWTDDLVDHAPNNAGCSIGSVSSWGIGTLPTGISNTTNGIIVALYPYSPISSGGVIQVNNIIINGTVDIANNPPSFAGGVSQALTICENSAATPINTLMAINDLDVGQTETWTVLAAPVNGTLGGFSTTAPSTGSTVAPSGLTYTPTPGFSGTDAFKIQISDGIASAITIVNVTVNPLPSAILGTTYICAGSPTSLTDATSGGTWVSSNTVVADIGSVSGTITSYTAGTATITYAAPTGCSVTTILTVNASPALINGTMSVCAGATTSLTNSVSGGTWSSSNTAIGTVSTTGVVSSIAAGTTIITYTMPGNCYTTITVTVYPVPTAINGTLVICQDLTTSLTNSVGGGTWSSSNTVVGTISGSGVVTGINNGTTTITYSIGTAGCNAYVVVTVNPLPALSSGTMNVCTGVSTTLTDITGDGTWVSSNTATAVIGSLSGTVFGVAQGTTTLSYILPTGCYSLDIMTVNPSPQAILGNHNMCIGLTTALTDVSTGGTWSSSNTAVGSIGIASGIAGGIATGTTTITYTLPAGCTATTTVTINSLPAAISGASNGCIGYTTTLSDATGGGTWSSSNSGIAGIGPATGFVTALSAGTATIDYTLNTGCYTSMVFTVDPPPAAISGTPYLCQGTTAIFYDGMPGGAWSSSNGNAIVGTSGSVTGVISGVVFISYTLPTTCFITYPLTITAAPTAITGVNTVCVNSAIVLTDGVSPGTWNVAPVTGNASIDAAGMLTGISQGVVTISYSTFSCNPVIYNVTVNPLPSAIIGTGSLCVGSSTSFSDATPGGTWSSSNATVNVSSGGVVTGVDTGAGTIISYTLPAGCYVTVPVIVFPIPAPIAGIDSVCPGDSVILADTTPLGVWSSSDGTIAHSIAINGVVKGWSPGNVTISYTLISGCYVTMPFKVENPVPAMLSLTQTPDTLLCAGATVTLRSHQVNGGVPTFEWDIFGAPVSFADTFRYNPAHGDYVVCKMTTHNVCASPAVMQDSIVVNVYPEVTPVVAITTLATSDTATYLGDMFTFLTTVTNGGVGATYQWYINSAVVMGATNSTFTTQVYDNNDTVWCVVTGTSPCYTGGNAGQSNKITIYGLGFLSVSSVIAGNSDLTLFPNPNSGSFALSGKLNTALGKYISLEVTDMLGRTVYTGTAMPQYGEVMAEIKLDDNIPAGSYLLRINTEAEVETFHFVISK